MCSVHIILRFAYSIKLLELNTVVKTKKMTLVIWLSHQHLTITIYNKGGGGGPFVINIGKSRIQNFGIKLFGVL